MKREKGDERERDRHVRREVRMRRKRTRHANL